MMLALIFSASPLAEATRFAASADSTTKATRQLPTILVWNPNHTSIGNIRMPQQMSFQFCRGDLERPDLRDSLRGHGLHGIAVADDGDGLINFDAIKHEKFILVIEHRLVASMDPSAPSQWYRKRQLPTRDDSPVDEGLLGSVDKPESSLCALT